MAEYNPTAIDNPQSQNTNKITHPNAATTKSGINNEEKKTEQLVLAYLRKRGYAVTEETFKQGQHIFS
jgi:hypothetical protein